LYISIFSSQYILVGGIIQPLLLVLEIDMILATPVLAGIVLLQGKVGYQHPDLIRSLPEEIVRVDQLTPAARFLKFAKDIAVARIGKFHFLELGNEIAQQVHILFELAVGIVQQKPHNFPFLEST